MFIVRNERSNNMTIFCLIVYNQYLFLDVQPEKLEAQDGDSLRAEMSYQIVSGKPDDYKEYFNIDRRTGS